MKCLCCNKTITDENSINGWHKSCIKEFFNTSSYPEIDFSNEKIKKIIEDNIINKTMVPGVQKKLSLHFFSKNRKNEKITLMNYLTGYILKPQSEKYPFLPEAEHLTMLMAKKVGISTVPHGLINFKNTYFYITKRIDRELNKDEIKKIAMEDFCQLSNKLTIDKYKGSYEKCAKIINEYSSNKLMNITNFFNIIVFSFITGNNDMHLKNFSLIEDKEHNYNLSPSYDLLPTKLFVKNDLDDLALTINGKNRNLHLNDFYKFAESIGLSKKVYVSIIKNILSKETEFYSLIDESYLSNELKEEYKNLIKERISTLNRNNL